ncbi:Abc transporter c family member 10 [Quillaja saponaria]|uniref:Abc transporter c family member 10 n=1 Tax=Quillaja saponaria TaxID=32244 RepID=A0AAD7Q385_QUISA|nr:Abc transporter c family member 10 [Quillaja saponaria]
MSDGRILQADPYHDLLTSSQQFRELVNAHKETAGSKRHVDVSSSQQHGNTEEEREVGDTGLKPLGRILSRVSSDLSIIDLDVPFSFSAVGITANVCVCLIVLSVMTWQVLFLSITMVYIALLLQRYYFASAKELMRINGTTKSFVLNHLAESVAGAVTVTIRAFEEEDHFFARNLDLIDINASPFFFIVLQQMSG